MYLACSACHATLTLTLTLTCSACHASYREIWGDISRLLGLPRELGEALRVELDVAEQLRRLALLHSARTAQLDLAYTSPTPRLYLR